MNGCILVIEHDPATRALLAGNLKDAGYRVFCASGVPDAKAVVREIRPDLTLFDWWLPGALGLAFARQMRGDRRTAHVSIIAVSARSEEHDRIAALEGGADDYLTKPFSMRELLARIKALMRRRTPQLGDDVVDFKGLRLDPAALRVSAGEHDIELWATNFRMLHFFMTHPGRIFGRAQLLDELWGDNVFVAERTIDVHIRRLRRALAPTGHDVLIETVRGIGYRLRTEPVPACHASVSDQTSLRGSSTSLPQVTAA
jgi:two-component system, OmpR family, phosphate regulon response regulator PhoB